MIDWSLADFVFMILPCMILPIDPPYGERSSQMAQHPKTPDQAFLRAVLDAPADDAVRLVYSDWLEEHAANQADRDRAEFIRSQVRLAGMNPWDDGFTALDIRCRQLERLHDDWCDVPEKLLPRHDQFSRPPHSHWRRGFIERLELKTGDLKKLPFFETNPITALHLTMEAPLEDEWLANPVLGRITSFEFGGWARERAREVAACLAERPPLEHFGDFGHTSGAESDALLALPAVAGTRSLAIHTPVAPNQSQAAFVGSAWPNLERLSRAGFSTLEWLRAPWVARLRTLFLDDSERRLGHDRKRTVAEVLPDTRIQTLELHGWDQNIAGNHALGRAVPRSQVRSLAVEQSRTNAIAARALVKGNMIENLRAFSLRCEMIDRDVVPDLLGSSLRICALDNLTADGLAALARPPGLPHVVDLRLGFRLRGDESLDVALRAVLEAAALPRLIRLTLCNRTADSSASIHSGDALATMIANCPAAAGLRELHLGPPIGRQGAAALANSRYLDGLQLLSVRLMDRTQVLSGRFGDMVFDNLPYEQAVPDF